MAIASILAILHRRLRSPFILVRPQQHAMSKANTQRIEQQHLTLRNCIKRLARKPIYFLLLKSFTVEGIPTLPTNVSRLCPRA